MSVEVEPRQLTLVSRGAAALVLVVFGGLAVVLPAGSVNGRHFGLVDQLLFFGVGLLLAAAALALSRFRVRADTTGIWVRNVRGERYFPWGTVRAIRMPDGAPWAELELHDDQTVALLAVQHGDGPRALRDLERLRARLAASQRSEG